jgi:hypothetical protein
VSDGVAITAGSGTTINTDDLGAAGHVQRVKPVWGADGTGTDTQVAQPLPVQSSIESSQMSMLGTLVTPLYVSINVSSSGGTTLLAAVSAKKIRVLAYSLVCDAAVAVKFNDGAAGTALTGAMSFAANGGISAPFCPAGHFQGTTNTLLEINLSAAVGVRGHLTYITG